MTKDQIIQLAIKEAKAQGIPPAKMLGLIQAESNFNPNAVSPVGAFGVTQFMPQTAKEMGVIKGSDENAIFSQVSGGAKYLKKMYDGLPEEHKSWENALRAYNGGLGNLLKEKKSGWQRGKSAMIENLNYPKRVAQYEKNYLSNNGDGVSEPVLVQNQSEPFFTKEADVLSSFDNTSNNEPFDFLGDKKIILDNHKSFLTKLEDERINEAFDNSQRKSYAKEIGLYDIISKKFWG